MLVLGISVCLGALALGWWWLRPARQAQVGPPFGEATAILRRPTVAAPGGGTPTRRPTATAVVPASRVTPSGEQQGATPSPRTPGGGGVTPLPPTATPVPPIPTAVAPVPTSPLVVEDFSIMQSAGVIGELMQSPAGRPVTVVFREETLNQDLAYLLARGGSQELRDVRVELRPEGIYVNATASLKGFEAKLRVLAVLAVRDCGLTVEIEDVRVGGFPAPGFVRREVEDAVTRYLTPWLEILPVCVERVTPGYGTVTVQAHR